MTADDIFHNFSLGFCILCVLCDPLATACALGVHRGGLGILQVLLGRVFFYFQFITCHPHLNAQWSFGIDLEGGGFEG